MVLDMGLSVKNQGAPSRQEGVLSLRPDEQCSAVPCILAAPGSRCERLRDVGKAIKVPCRCALSQPIGRLPITRRPPWAVVAASLGGFGDAFCHNRDRDMPALRLSALRPAFKMEKEKKEKKTRREKEAISKIIFQLFSIQAALFPFFLSLIRLAPCHLDGDTHALCLLALPILG